jgi:hypothetical protein
MPQNLRAWPTSHFIVNGRPQLAHTVPYAKYRSESIKHMVRVRTRKEPERANEICYGKVRYVTVPYGTVPLPCRRQYGTSQRR